MKPTVFLPVEVDKVEIDQRATGAGIDQQIVAEYWHIAGLTPGTQTVQASFEQADRQLQEGLWMAGLGLASPKQKTFLIRWIFAG